MKKKTICLVIDVKFSVVLLSSRESLFLTTIRQVSRSSVGVFPLLIRSGGSLCFTIGIVSPPFHRVMISAEFSSKFSNEFHTLIWDPGISRGGSEDRNMKLRSLFIANPCSLFLSTVLAISVLVLAWHNQRTTINGIRRRQWVIDSSSTLWHSFSRCNVTLLLFWSLIEWFINADGDLNCLILKKYTRLKDNNGHGFRDEFLSLRTPCNSGDVFTVFRLGLVGIDQILRLQNGLDVFRWESIDIGGRTQKEKAIAHPSDSTAKRTMDINGHQWLGYYRRHDSESFQATYQSIFSIKVMRQAFRSFIYKMIACYKCMKRGLNRFILLPVRLLLESRVTSTSSSKLGFNFLYLFQRLYLNFSCLMYHVNLL